MKYIARSIEQYFAVVAFTLFSTAIAQAEIVQFKIKSEDIACKSSPQISVTENGRLVYRFKSPVSGAAQVQLLTGTYQIAASSSECGFQQALQVSELPNTPLEIKLAQSVLVSSTATGPCLWGAYGCDGGFYAHSGDVMITHANIYAVNSRDSKFMLKFAGDNLNLLATSPEIQEKLLQGETRQQIFHIDNVRYPYLFYAARISSEHMQNTQAFCGHRRAVIQLMTEGLRKSNFPEQAISDLSSFISVRFPEALKYCVYPQLNAIMDKAAPLEMVLKDKSVLSVERAFYLVVPQDHNGQKIPAKSSRFSDKPEKVWKPKAILAPSKTKTPDFYEWGVGFVFE